MYIHTGKLKKCSTDLEMAYKMTSPAKAHRRPHLAHRAQVSSCLLSSYTPAQVSSCLLSSGTPGTSE